MFSLCRLKKITTCCLLSSGDHLLIGTDSGNIYSLDVKSFEMTDHIIYQDIVIQKWVEMTLYLHVINILY